MTDPTHPSADPSPDTAKASTRAAAGVLREARNAGGRWVRLTALCGLGETVCAIVFAAGVALVVSEAVSASVAGETAALWAGAGLAVAGAVGRGLATFMRTRVSFEAGAQCRLWARGRVAAAIRRLGPAHTETRETGAIVSALIDETEALNGYVSRYAPQIMIVVAAPLAVAIAAFTSSWVAGAVFLTTAPLAPLFMALAGMGAAEAAKDQFDELARLAGRFNDRLRALPTLKAFNATARELTGLGEAADRFRKGTMKVLRMAFLSSLFLEFFAVLSIAIVAVYVGFSLLGEMPFSTGETVTLREGLFVLILAPEFYLPLRQLAGAYHDRQSARGAAERLAIYLDPQRDLAPDQAPAGVVGAHETTTPHLNAAPSAVPPSFHFDAVHAIYPDGRPGLAGASFTAPGGQITALVGQSGSGKSTALKVMMGFIAPRSGTVRLEDRDWAAGPGFGDACAWMSQRARLFHGTVRDNIALGAPDADAAAIADAAARAGALDFITDLEDGFDTMLGEAGFGLSGGQAQRIALARALIAQRPVILLDEPTAGLDAQTETDFLTALTTAGAGRTVIMATHSARATAIADHVVQLVNGRRV